MFDSPLDWKQAKINVLEVYPGAFAKRINETEQWIIFFNDSELNAGSLSEAMAWQYAWYWHTCGMKPPGRNI